MFYSREDPQSQGEKKPDVSIRGLGEVPDGTMYEILCHNPSEQEGFDTGILVRTVTGEVRDGIYYIDRSKQARSGDPLHIVLGDSDQMEIYVRDDLPIELDVAGEPSHVILLQRNERGAFEEQFPDHERYSAEMSRV